MGSNTKQTWLVTGSSSGLGLNISLSALRAGHFVIATARDVRKAAREHPAIEEKGGKWLELDVRSEDTEEIVRKAVDELAGGRIDVVVNNAGYTVVSSLEDTRISTMNDMLSTHLFGALRVLKGILPFFRRNHSGTVVNMSSILGQVAFPGSGPYSLCKFALEGASEALAAELAPFGIRVVILEPGGFRTQLMKKDGVLSSEAVGDHYQSGGVGNTRMFVQALAEKEEELVAGDPRKLGDMVVDIVDRVGMGKELEHVLRVPLGNDAFVMIDRKIENMQKELSMTRILANACDFEGHAGEGVAAL